MLSLPQLPSLSSAVMRVLLIAAAITIVGAVTYHLGHASGAASVRDAARAAQLDTNRVAIAALTPRLQAAERAEVAAAARVPVAEKHYQAARSRISIADSAHVAIDSGPVLELPPPVIATMARADTLIPELRAQVIAEHAWGLVWHDKAVLLQQRVDLLEGQLGDERSSKHRAEVKAAAIGAGVLELIHLVVHS